MILYQVLSAFNVLGCLIAFFVYIRFMIKYVIDEAFVRFIVVGLAGIFTILLNRIYIVFVEDRFPVLEMSQIITEVCVFYIWIFVLFFFASLKKNERHYVRKGLRKDKGQLK